MRALTITEKLSKLRQLMAEHSLDFYFVPSVDPHKNEYVPDHWQRRPWISDFTGSAGDVLIGKEQAYLWTDPRYFLQAEQQLDDQHYQLMRQQQGMAAPINQWLAKNAKQQNVGVDPKLISATAAQKWQAALKQGQGQLISLDDNLVDQIWPDQPTLHSQPIRLYPETHAGETTTEKLKRLRTALTELNAEIQVITALDAIAWLFNIRGDDIQYNPLVISYAIITQTTATLFVDTNKITSDIKNYFQQHAIQTQDYSDFQTTLQSLTGSVLIDPNSTSWWTEQQLKQAKIIKAYSPITQMKAIKNKTEQAGMKEAHRLDAIAVIKFLHWLDHHWQGQTEISAADQLEAFRREESRCLDLSFATISGFAEHGAIIHYFATPETNIEINDQALLLVDSGGQYYEGTTDITRTVHLGTPTAEEKKHYSLVLKGHLQLRHTVFPQGRSGEHLDAIAHLALWQENLDYGHGTGHGVGCNLCVHEGPQRISGAATGVPLEDGMIVSNEPGVYFSGKYGIRIENLCLIKQIANIKDSATGHGPFLTFNRSWC